MKNLLGQGINYQTTESNQKRKAGHGLKEASEQQERTKEYPWRDVSRSSGYDDDENVLRNKNDSKSSSA